MNTALTSIVIILILASLQASTVDWSLDDRSEGKAVITVSFPVFLPSQMKMKDYSISTKEYTMEYFDSDIVLEMEVNRYKGEITSNDSQHCRIVLDVTQIKQRWLNRMDDDETTDNVKGMKGYNLEGVVAVRGVFYDDGETVKLVLFTIEEEVFSQIEEKGCTSVDIDNQGAYSIVRLNLI